MPLSPGTKLGPYEVRSPLGAGAMGEVYSALDTRLGREVALKILPESFASNNERLHRFEQETRAVATLNHPNILAIYDVGQHNGAPFLVSELLEGETLRAILDRGAMPQRKVIDYGVQIAQGLAAAHDKGIVHRDLKPENLFITKDGRAKILDFGLAKLAQNPTAVPEGVTLTNSPTAAGVVMGTASYMAPEQVRGEAVDARTDIFAFGAVLFEMLSGKRAFRRDTMAETMTAVLKDELPPFETAEHVIAPGLDRIIRRCLEKNPEQRFQSARDLSFALGVLSGTEGSGAARAANVAGGAGRSKTWMAWGLAAIAAAVAIGIYMRPHAEISRMQFTIAVPGEVSHVSLSADGKMLAYISPDEKTGAPTLFVQKVGTPAATELAGTEGASYPFWSPDNRYVGFFANGKLEKIAAAGGAPQILARVTSARGGSWGSKNVLIFSPDAGGPIWRVNADGSNPKPLTEKLMSVEESHRWPFFLPDGEHFLYLAARFSTPAENQRSSIYLSSIDGRESKQILQSLSNPEFVDGYMFYVDGKKALRAARLDIGKAAIATDSQVVVDSVGYQPSVYRGAYSVGGDGTIVYSESATSAESVLTWYDKSGKKLERVGEIGVQANPSLSPDGERVALDITDLKANNLDVWIEDIKKQTSTRFTFDPAEETTPVWSRDGKTIAYRSITAGAAVIVKNASGLEPGKRALLVGRRTAVTGLMDSYDLIPNSWSLDGKQILCSLQMASKDLRGSLLVLVPAVGGDAVRFLNDDSSQTNGQISADGKWAAYASSESGDWEIYVTTFPGATGKWQISRGGGSEPRWRNDGKAIYYLGPTGMLMEVPVDAGATLSSGTPAPLFQVRGRAPISSTDIFTYDVTRDGQRFLVNEYVKPGHVLPLTIVRHAFDDVPK